MEIHPLCSIFPDMPSEDFSELCVSIAKNGIRHPVVVHKGQVLDGRNRQRAGLLLGVEIPYKEWNGDDSEEALIEFVADCNLNRRDLTPGQRAAIGVEIKERLEVEYAKRRTAGKKIEPKEGESPSPKIGGRSESARGAAATVGVSHGYISDAARIRKQSPDLFNEVKQGEKTIPQAKRELAERTKPYKESMLSFDSEDIEPDPRTILDEESMVTLTSMKRKYKQFANTEDVLSRIESLINAIKIAAV